MSRPLKFLHITTFYPPYSFGGDAMYIYRLAHALGEEGHQIDVVHCVDSYHLLHPAQPPIQFAEHPNVKRHELRSGVRWLSPLLTQQTGQPYLKTRVLRDLMASRQYDVIQFHNTSLIGPGALRMDTPSRRSVKMYMTHEHWLICPMHVLWKMNSRACEKPECLKCALAARRPPQLWRYTGLLDRTAKYVDQFVSPSRFTARMHAERGFPEPVDHLPYFIDRADSDWRTPEERPHQNPYFLFVGRLEVIKGLQTLIELWRARKLPYDLLVAGTGTQDAQLREAASEVPRIKFLGPLSQRQLGALYHHALACIVPSITYETFGIIIIEAFARQTPVIVRDLGALPEVIEDSGGGFVYRNDDDLIQAMQTISDSPALRFELGRKGYAAFERLWSKEAHMQLYFDYLRRAAIRRHGGVPWES
jgi:glycosyltransferase involved in cell wall biosynthesis